MACEEHFETRTTRDRKGRFIVKLPFKQEITKLGDSFEQAKRRLLSLEKRLPANPPPEQKKQHKTEVTSCIVSNKIRDSIIDIQRFSNLTRLYHAVSFVCKAKDQFLFLLHKQDARPELVISFQDTQLSKFLIISRLQQ